MEFLVAIKRRLGDRPEQQLRQPLRWSSHRNGQDPMLQRRLR